MANINRPTYIIPDNFIEGGKILNGMFRIRNLIEAIVIGLFTVLILSLIPFASKVTKFTVILSVAGPIFMICLMGINGGSVVEFLLQFKKWRNNRRIMLFNNSTNSRAVRPGDVVLSQEFAKDRLVKMLDERKAQKKQNNENRALVEGRDFEFIEDDDFNESFVKAEQKLLGIDEINEKEKNKKPKKTRKRLKKGKEPLLLSENNPIHNNETGSAVQTLTEKPEYYQLSKDIVSNAVSTTEEDKSGYDEDTSKVEAETISPVKVAEDGISSDMQMVFDGEEVNSDNKTEFEFEFIDFDEEEETDAQ